MKYQFTETQVNVLLNSLDIALKQVGLKGVYTIVELLQILQNPQEHENDAFKVYELDENQVQSLKQVLDIAIKATGLNGAHLILDVVQALQHPVQPIENE